MHEVSIMQSALEAAERHARARGATRIHRIILRIGAASGVEPDALEFAFGPVTDGTMAHGAALEIVRLPVVCFCKACDIEFEPPDILFACPTCRAVAFDVRQGREMDLASLEVS